MMSNFLLFVIAFLLTCIADELTRIRKAIESRSNAGAVPRRNDVGTSPLLGIPNKEG